MAHDAGLFDGEAVAEADISPGRERRWGQARLILLMLGLSTIAYGPTVVAVLATHQPPGAFVSGVAGVGTLVIAFVPMFAADCIGPAVSLGGPPARYLTGKTYTGWRSVDLRDVVSVRYRLNASIYGDELIVTDVQGARLGVFTWDSPAVRCIGDAAQHRAGRGVKVSRSAAPLDLH